MRSCARAMSGQATAPPVGAGEKRRRHGEAERLGGLKIDYELELGGFLNLVGS